MSALQISKMNYRLLQKLWSSTNSYKYTHIFCIMYDENLDLLHSVRTPAMHFYSACFALHTTQQLGTLITVL